MLLNKYLMVEQLSFWSPVYFQINTHLSCTDEEDDSEFFKSRIRNSWFYCLFDKFAIYVWFMVLYILLSVMCFMLLFYLNKIKISFMT